MTTQPSTTNVKEASTCDALVGGEGGKVLESHLLLNKVTRVLELDPVSTRKKQEEQKSVCWCVESRFPYLVVCECTCVQCREGCSPVSIMYLSRVHPEIKSFR